jgi:5'(3')-deoxyribonucleotidase
MTANSQLELGLPRYRCFLDMDGILADFVEGVMTRFNRRISMAEWPSGEFNIETALGLPPGRVWGSQNEQFWSGLPPTPDGKQILDLVETQFGQDNVCILSSPSANPASLSGKLIWIKAHIPDYRRRFLIGPPKHFCAAPTHVLIDDSDKNVVAFREAGGIGILLPRPWNALHEVGDPVSYLREQLALLPG